jgi:putative DNA primase/helicase
MNGDQDKISYLQRVLGYATTGVTREHCFFILCGFGSNGKSTLFEYLRELLSDYVGNLPNESLLLNFRTIRSDLVKLQGQRIVTTSELKEEIRSLDEALIKQLTAGDRTTARESGRNEVDFTPQLKLFVATNHLPTIRGIDNGIWRRVRLIPFDASFEGEGCDKNIIEKFRPEAAGILNWLIEGCLEWQQQGLNEPHVITKEIAKFREDSNPVKLFIDDSCDKVAGEKIQLQDLYLEYGKWCKANCYVPENVIPFGKRMVALRYEKGKTGDVRYWKNLKFKSVDVKAVGVNVGVDLQSDPAQLSPELPDPEKLQHTENTSEDSLLVIN